MARDPPAGLAHLDDVRLAIEPELIRPHRQRAEQLPSRPVLEPRQVRVLVVQVASQRVLVRAPQPVVNLKCRPARAEKMVIEQREGERLNFGE